MPWQWPDHRYYGLGHLRRLDHSPYETEWCNMGLLTTAPHVYLELSLKPAIGHKEQSDARAFSRRSATEKPRLESNTLIWLNLRKLCAAKEHCRLNYDAIEVVLLPMRDYDLSTSSLQDAPCRDGGHQSACWTLDQYRGCLCLCAMTILCRLRIS